MGDPAAVIDAIAGWAAEQGDVHAVALVGSYARGTATVASDIDFVLVVDDVDRRLGRQSWLGDFGEVRQVEHEDWGLVQSLRVVFHDGPEVEFGLTTVEWTNPPLDEGTKAVIRGGLRILFDPHNLVVEAVRAAKDAGSTDAHSGTI